MVTTDALRFSESCLDPLESAARAALEARGGRCFTDSEWMRVQRNLLEFMNILRTWDQQAKMSKREA
jgi:hypothetical protein